MQVRCALLAMTLLAACASRTATHDEVCATESRVLTASEVGDVGFSGDDLYSAATADASTLAVTWVASQGSTTPPSDVFEISYGSIGEVREVTTDPACSARVGRVPLDLEVDVEADLASEDGEVAASGPVTFVAENLKDVFFDMSVDAVLLGAHADAAASALPTIDRTYVGTYALYVEGALRQHFTIAVEGTDGTTGENLVVYGCQEGPDTECIASADK